MCVNTNIRASHRNIGLLHWISDGKQKGNGFATLPCILKKTNPNSRYEYTKKDADGICAQCADSSKYIYAI